MGAGGQRVLVAGAGAIGSVVGGLLARAGWAVTLLGRRPHLEAVRRDGLRIDGLFGAHRVRGLTCAIGRDDLAGSYAVVFLTVKAYDTETVVEAVRSHLDQDGVLVSLQNGLGNLEMAERALGGARVLGGRVIFGAERPAPGHARVTVCADPVLLGSPDGKDARRVRLAAEWASHLNAAGVPTRPTSAIVPELWAKVLYSAALNPLGALLGLPYGALAADPDARAVMDEVIEEAFAVARAEGVALDWPDPAAYRATFYERLVPATAAHRSSMLQDIERGRPTEVDAINGHVAARGAARGLPAPTNAALARLVRARARRGRDRGAP